MTAEQIAERFAQRGYVASDELATALELTLALEKPLLIEGHAGVGKTECAKVLAALLETRLIRLQCYEGLDIAAAVYEWNYPKQLLHIRLTEGAGESLERREAEIFSEPFLLKRPLLAAILQTQRPVLLIDEVDRADEAFEAFLLELLGEFQVTIPEIGTISASERPVVILTSNRTRELSDALRRRCLYLWVDFPSAEQELAILRARLPEIDLRLAQQIVDFLQALRERPLEKLPGVAESLDWAAALMRLHPEVLDAATIDRTLGCILKARSDIEYVRRQRAADAAARRAAETQVEPDYGIGSVRLGGR
ncbi:MAG: AAA family ATPase [Vulcanimicrobiaceae bacterium]